MSNAIPEIPSELKQDWRHIEPDALEKVKSSIGGKFLNRELYVDLYWKRLHNEMPELLNKKLKILDVGCGNGVILEILRWYGHDVTGMDYTPGYDKGDWLYKPLIESQGLKCINHSGGDLPYPFKDKEFDLLICYGAITFFGSKTPWVNILNEFTRITKSCILLGVNVGDEYNKEKENIDSWKSDQFKMEWNKNSIYKWIAK